MKNREKGPGSRMERRVKLRFGPGSRMERRVKLRLGPCLRKKSSLFPGPGLIKPLFRSN